MIFNYSIRRQRKAEDLAGITLNNTIAPGLLSPGLLLPGGDDDVSTAADFGKPTPSPRRTPQMPRTPQMLRSPKAALTPNPRRKAFATDKSSVSVDVSGGRREEFGGGRKERTSLAPKHKSVKMDVARAMGIMGFNSSRWLDASQVRIEINIYHSFIIIVINTL